MPGSGCEVHPGARPYEIVLEEMKMPHIIVKLHSGRAEEQKQQLTEEIVKDVIAIAKCVFVSPLYP